MIAPERKFQWNSEGALLNPEVLGKLIEQLEHPLMRLCRSMTTDGEAALDAFQSTCLSAWLQIFEFEDRGPGSLLAWMSTIARRECVSLNRRERLRRHRRLDGALAASTFDEAHFSMSQLKAEPLSAVDRLSKLELFGTVRAAMQSLPRPLLELIMMHHEESLSHREISGIKGIPLGTVKSRLRRAHRRLGLALVEEPVVLAEFSYPPSS